MAVDKALRAIRVEYEVQEPLLDFTKALDNDIVVHPEDDWKPLVDVGGDNKRNLVAKACDRHGDIDASWLRQTSSSTGRITLVRISRQPWRPSEPMLIKTPSDG